MEALTPREFLERHGLPRCARVLPQSGELSLLGQRVLLYRFYRSNRVEAVLEDAGSGTLVIPQLYDGWFSVVTERGQIKAKCYTAVQRLVSSQVSSFLTITDITAYTLNNPANTEGKKQHYVKTTVKGGEVVKLLAVYQDIGSSGKRMSWAGEGTRYAQCLTQSDQVVYIPVTTCGQFYATANSRRDDSVTKVYQLSRLLKTFPLPVRVCIINGCKAQGSMVLETFKTEEVILACSLGKENKLLEIDVNSKFLIVDDQMRTADYDIMSALQYTRLHWDRWRRQLKIAHHIYPKLPQRLPKPPLTAELPYVEVKDSVEEAIYAEITS